MTSVSVNTLLFAFHDLYILYLLNISVASAIDIHSWKDLNNTCYLITIWVVETISGIRLCTLVDAV